MLKIVSTLIAALMLVGAAYGKEQEIVVRLTWDVAGQQGEQVVPLPTPATSARIGAMQVKGGPETAGDCNGVDTGVARNSFDDGFVVDLRAGPATETGAIVALEATFGKYLGIQNVVRRGASCELRFGAGRREILNARAYLRYGEPVDLILQSSDHSIRRVTAVLLRKLN